MSDMTIVIAEHICGRIADLDHQPELCKEAAKTLPELLAEYKAQQDRITQLQQDNHRLHEHELLLDGEVKRLEAEAQDYHDQKEAALGQLVRERQELQAEAARWQAAAVEERAIRIWYNVDKHPEQYSWLDAMKKDKDRYRQQAAAALGQPRAWPMNKERIKALEAALSILESEIIELNGEDYMGAVHARQSLEGIAEEIRAMLAEAKQE